MSRRRRAEHRALAHGARVRLVVGEADRLVDYILNVDKDVFHELLTTDQFYVFHSGDNDAMASSSARIRRIYDHFKDVDWKNYSEADLQQHDAH